MKKIVIEPKFNPFKIKFKELYEYKELLFALTYRDYRVRYAQTAIGFLWALINPLFTLTILAFVFGAVANIDVGLSDSGREIPHVIYTIAGMCGWTYFSTVLGQAGGSIIGAQQMVQKIYFPRLIIPLSKAITGFIDFIIVIAILATLMVIYQFPPSANIIYMPFFFLIAVLSGLTGGIWMSALTIRYRDFQHITPLLLRVGMYATPIAYPATKVPEAYQALFYLNPMAGVVEGMRWSIIGGPAINSYAYISFGIIAVLFVLGVFYFNKVERIMPDII